MLTHPLAAAGGGGITEEEDPVALPLIDDLETLVGTKQNASTAATDAELAAAVAALEASIAAIDTSGSQPLDSDLTAIAALTTTSFGRALLEVANAAGLRTAAGLGTAATHDDTEYADAVHTHAESDVTGLVSDLAGKQPVDSDLTSIAALTTTAFGRSLLEAANAGALRTLAGLGTAALSNTGDFDAAGAAAAAQAASQPLDADLTAIAALTTTSFGRSLIALANGAALLAAAGAAAASHTHAESDVTGLVTDLAGKQPLDSDLTALAALTTTAYGRSVLETADAAALRTLAGLVIGTNVQAQNANLAAIAGLTSAANKMTLWTGSGTASVIDVTSFAQTILDDTNAAGVRGTIAVPGLTTANDFTGLNSFQRSIDGVSARIARFSDTIQTADIFQIKPASLSGNLVSVDKDGKLKLNTDLELTEGGTGASDASGARTNLGLGALAVLATINGSLWSGADLAVVDGGTGASDAATARTNLGLGALAVLASINGSNWSGQDLAVADGGTAASTASAARWNVGAYKNFGDGIDSWGPSGAIVESLSRTILSPGFALVSGTMLCMGNLVIPDGATITNVTTMFGNAGAGLTHTWMCLLKQSDRSVLQKTADDTGTTVTTAAFYTKALAAPYVNNTGADLPVYLGIVSVFATTAPQVRSFAGSATALGFAPILVGTGSTGLTTPGAFTGPGAALTATANPVYGALS